MAQTRRIVLKAAGGAIVITAAAGGLWSLTRDPKQARGPWTAAAAAGFGDPRLDALAYAILAPNPHNMQPWRVRLDRDDAFFVEADPSRLLPQTDPYGRQVTIGFGAFLELFRLAAAENGMDVRVTPFPEGEPHPSLDARPIAHVRLHSDATIARDPLFGAILIRRTNRAPFSDERVGETALRTIAAEAADPVKAAFTAEETASAGLRDLAIEAWRIEWALARTRNETIDVTRIGKREIEASPWGITLAGPMLEGLGALGILTREEMGREGSSTYEQTLLVYEQAIAATNAFVWAITPTNTRLDQLHAGRAWVRMQLAANAQKLAFHPLSQALQEFPEMAGPYARAHGFLAPDGGTVQMLARIGHAQQGPPAPREPLMAKIDAA